MQNILKIEGYKLLNQEVYRLLKKSITKEILEPGCGNPTGKPVAP